MIVRHACSKIVTCSYVHAYMHAYIYHTIPYKYIYNIHFNSRQRLDIFIVVLFRSRLFSCHARFLTTHTYIHIHIHVCIHTYIHTHSSLAMPFSTEMYTCLMYLCMYICLYVWYYMIIVALISSEMFPCFNNHALFLAVGIDEESLRRRALVWWLCGKPKKKMREDYMSGLRHKLRRLPRGL